MPPRIMTGIISAYLPAQTARSQLQNRELALARFQTLLAQALRPAKPRKKTRPSRTAVEKRLANKRKQSEKKKERRGDW